ncbi:MAG: OmpA family protein [Bacteroidales bacterium]|nr:OmpA family protein [Bacteroidales bacterium]
MNFWCNHFLTPELGEFLIPLPTNGMYALNVSRSGYLFYSSHFSLEKLEDPTQAWAMDIPLQPIKVGSKVILNNIFFDTDSTNLKPESLVELKKLSIFLKTNHTVKIELGGHTDNSGQKAKNITLSVNRAKSVYDYLVKSGISPNRLKYKGYADEMPIVPNTTAENKAKNRRTEFTVLEK